MFDHGSQLLLEISVTVTLQIRGLQYEIDITLLKMPNEVHSCSTVISAMIPTVHFTYNFQANSTAFPPLNYQLQYNNSLDV